MFSQWLLNAKGRKIRRIIESRIDDLDDTVDKILDDRSALHARAKALGRHLIFLKERTLAKMEINIINLDKLFDLFNPEPGRGSEGNEPD